VRRYISEYYGWELEVTVEDIESVELVKDMLEVNGYNVQIIIGDLLKITVEWSTHADVSAAW